MKKKSILIVLAVLLVFIAVTPIRESLAYFTAYDEAEGNGTVDLVWSTTIVESFPYDRDKNITILNTGETPVIVRVQVFSGEFAATYSVEDGKWIQEDDGWWYYSEILEPGDESSALYAKVNLETAPDYDFNIVVVHESSRVFYVDGTNTIATPEGWTYVPDAATSGEGGAD